MRRQGAHGAASIVLGDGELLTKRKNLGHVLGLCSLEPRLKIALPRSRLFGQLGELTSEIGDLAGKAFGPVALLKAFGPFPFDVGSKLGGPAFDFLETRP